MVIRDQQKNRHMCVSVCMPLRTMNSDVEDRTYASITCGEDGNLADIRASLKIKLLVLSSETLPKGNNHVKDSSERIIIGPTKEYFEAEIRKTVVFRTKNIKR